MDFAKTQLTKYGWTEGKGLGKNEDGMSNALKPKSKQNVFGIGFDVANEFTDKWWENVYNKAAQNVTVNNTGDEVKISQTTKDSVKITTKDYAIKSSNNNGLKFGTFVKTAQLVDNKLESLPNSALEEIRSKSTSITDEQLFEACEGRTAHKGARHGIHQLGKLARLEKQEKLLMKKLEKVKDDPTKTLKAEKKLNHITKTKEKLEDEHNSNGSKKKKRKEKKREKKVCFNDTVIEYQVPLDLDSSFHSNESSDIPETVVSETKIKDRSDDEDDLGSLINPDYKEYYKVDKLNKIKKKKKHDCATQRFLKEIRSEEQSCKRKLDKDTQMSGICKKFCNKLVVTEKKKSKL